MRQHRKIRTRQAREAGTTAAAAANAADVAWRGEASLRLTGALRTPPPPPQRRRRSAAAGRSPTPPPPHRIPLTDLGCFCTAFRTSTKGLSRKSSGTLNETDLTRSFKPLETGVQKIWSFKSQIRVLNRQNSISEKSRFFALPNLTKPHLS